MTHTSWRDKRSRFYDSPVPATLTMAGLLLALACTVAEPPAVPSPSDSLGTAAAGAEQSVIIQGGGIEALAAAVRAVGGRVTHELGIIQAVGAQVSTDQLAALRTVEGLVIRENRAVAVEDSTETVRDDFDATSYSGNNGTRAWSGDWLENDSGDANGGDLRVRSDSKCSAGNCLRIRAKQVGAYVYREVDLSDASEATLSFDYRLTLEDDDEVVVEVSPDGGAQYAVLQAFHQGTSDGDSDSDSGATASASFDLTAYVGPATRVRFRVTGKDDKKYLYIDNLQINLTLGALPPEETPPPEVSEDAATLSDSFDEISYDGSNGMLEWVTPWWEEGDDDQEDYGGVRVYDSSHCASGNCLKLNGAYGPNRRLTRAADLSGAAMAVLGFSFEHQLGDGDRIVLEVSGDKGQTFTTLRTYDGGTPQLATESIDLSSVISPVTFLRWSIVAEDPSAAGSMWIDDFEIKIDDYVPDVTHTRRVSAGPVHAAGFTGAGITVAVIDTGLWDHPALVHGAEGQDRLLVQYDAINDQVVSVGGQSAVDNDTHGHGTHVSSVIVNSESSLENGFHGLAPNANLVSVKAFGSDGGGTYLDVIRAIDFVVTRREDFDIRVLNLSFSGEPMSHYWDDPLNQAVMAAWEAGIVVVVAAGNRGPDPMTIGVPGNVPYVVTVGAVSDNTTQKTSDDFLASFSSTGPTVEGFVKPEIVAPGGHVLAIMPGDSVLGTSHAEWHDGLDYFMMSGTSQAAAVVSGIVALMLEYEPWLTPDDVKCELMTSGHVAVSDGQTMAYSVFQQGAGLVNAHHAVKISATGCANQGLDVAKDLSGEEHYGGLANQDEEGNYYLEVVDGTTWGSGYLWGGGYIWGTGYNWQNNYQWTNGYIWGNGFIWGNGYIWGTNYSAWDQGVVWSNGLTETMSADVWVPQE